MSKNTSIPSIVEIKLKDLQVDESLSGRSKKEIAANAKDLAPKMEALGFWDMSQPGQFFERDGKKHLIAGFTRHAAAELAGLKVGYFVQVDDDPALLRTACIRTNLGKPVSAFEQGRIYAAMRDGTNPETAQAGETLMAPMELKAIAAEVGYSITWIAMCIAMCEETPEIGELLQDGKVSPGIVTRARQLVKADGKRLAFLKAAYQAAKADGKEMATAKHLDSVRAEFAPLKADTGKSEKKEEKKDDAPKDEEKPGKEAPSHDDEPSEKEVKPHKNPPPMPQSSLDLGATVAKPVSASKNRKAIVDVLQACDDELESEQAEKYASALIDAGFGILSPL